MLENNIRISWRNLWLNRLYSGISVVGLATGIPCMLFAVLYWNDEQSFDTFHKMNPDLYRIIRPITEMKEVKNQRWIAHQTVVTNCGGVLYHPGKWNKLIRGFYWPRVSIRVKHRCVAHLYWITLPITARRNETTCSIIRLNTKGQVAPFIAITRQKQTAQASDTTMMSKGSKDCNIKRKSLKE